jgi:putative DNA methylase
VVTDPPFFDNVHYSELADFFFAWHERESFSSHTTRHAAEVQDADSEEFSRKLQNVFTECGRILKDDGLLVFTYHHSRVEGWAALARAVLGAGFAVVNSHPVKAEMSVATPKTQAKEPIQIDIVLVCRKVESAREATTSSDAIRSAKLKMERMRNAGFSLSKNDSRVILFGQLLVSVRHESEFAEVEVIAEREMAALEMPALFVGVTA